MKKINKIIAMVLSLALMAGVLPIKSYAAENECKAVNLPYKTVVQVEYDGQVYDVEMTSNLPFEQDKKTTRDWSPQYEEGAVRNVSFNITRAQLGGIHAGAEVGIAIINKIAVEALKKAIPGLGWISIVAIVGSGAMYAVGVEGFHVDVELEYKSYCHHKDGYCTYDWSITDVDISSY